MCCNPMSHLWKHFLKSEQEQQDHEKVKTKKPPPLLREGPNEDYNVIFNLYEPIVDRIINAFLVINHNFTF